MPVDLVHADSHGRKQKPVAEQSAAGQRLGRRDQLRAALARGPSSSSWQSCVQICALRAIGLPYRPRSSAAVLNSTWAMRSSCGRNGQFVLVAMHAGPAVRASIRCCAPGRASPSDARRPGRGSCIQPDCGTRMPYGCLVPLERVQQRNLRRPAAALPPSLRYGWAPQNTRLPGNGSRCKLARQIGPAHRRRQAAERPERQQILHAAQAVRLCSKRTARSTEGSGSSRHSASGASSARQECESRPAPDRPVLASGSP